MLKNHFTYENVVISFESDLGKGEHLGLCFEEVLRVAPFV